jgi:hypothetical protein
MTKPIRIAAAINEDVVVIMKIVAAFLFLILGCSACTSNVRIDKSLRNVLTQEKAQAIRELVISASKHVRSEEGTMLFTKCDDKELAIIGFRPYEERFIKCDYVIDYRRKKRDCVFRFLGSLWLSPKIWHN